jgi:hypothetical protein
MTVTEIKVDTTFIKLMDELRMPDRDSGLIEAGRKNIVVFAERMLGLAPPGILKPSNKKKYGHIYSWQVFSLRMIQQALESRINPSVKIKCFGGESAGHIVLTIDDREFVIITSRQIGKSVMLSILSLWCTIYNVVPSGAFNSSNVLIVSASDVQAKKLLYEMKKMLMVGDKYMAMTYLNDDGSPAFGTEFFTSLLSNDDPNNTTTISFVPQDEEIHGILLQGSRYGSSIKSYPPTSSVLGECQIGSDKVLLSNGRYKRIDKIQVGDEVASSDHYNLVFKKVTGVKNNGIQKVIKITTCRGKNITVTYNHPVMTTRGWVKAEDLNIKDKIAGLVNLEKINKNTITEFSNDEVAFLGYMLGDGTCSNRKWIKFTQMPGPHREEFIELCTRLGFANNLHIYNKDNGIGDVAVGVAAWDLLERAGMAGKYSGTKELPINFNFWPINQKALFLNRYYSCDGWITTTKNNEKNAYRIDLGLFTKSKNLAEQVQHALSLFGIVSGIRKRIKNSNGKEYEGYEVGIRSKKHVKKFFDNIGIKSKFDDFDVSLFEGVTQSDTYNFMDFEFESIRYIEHLDDPEETFGISVEDTECYVSNGLLNHNSSGLVIIDEAGMTERITDQFFYDYLYPVGNSTDAIRIYTSTPWLVSGFFYRLVNPDGVYTDTPSQVYLFTIDAIKYENESYYNRVMKTVKQLVEDGKKDEVQRAYYCRFVKGESSYFNPEDIYPVFSKDSTQLTKFEAPCDMGVDFGGQVKSRTVITISHLDPENIARRIYHKVYEVGKDLSLLEDIQELRTRFNIQRIVVDDCAAGSVYITKMKDAGWEVQPMSFRGEKVKKYGAFRIMLKRGRIKSYEDDSLKTEMLALEFTPGSRQSNIQHAPGYSDDLLDSFLMSCYFYLEDEQKVEFFQW